MFGLKLDERAYIKTLFLVQPFQRSTASPAIFTNLLQICCLVITPERMKTKGTSTLPVIESTPLSFSPSQRLGRFRTASSVKDFPAKRRPKYKTEDPVTKAVKYSRCKEN